MAQTTDTSPTAVSKSIPSVELNADGELTPVVFFPGRVLFNLKATHGIPLDFAIDHILNANPDGPRCFIEWPSYIEEARRNKRWDFQTYDDIRHALEDCVSYSKEQQKEILDRFKIFVLKYPHPEVK